MDPKLTDQKLRALIGQAIRLDRGIKQAEQKLKGLKAEIALELEARPELPTNATEGGGTSVVFEGTGNNIARVTWAGRSLKGSISTTDKNLPRIKQLAGADFPTLFKSEMHFVPIERFRETAAELLGTLQSRPLIKLCENAGKTSVSFETKAETVPAVH